MLQFIAGLDFKTSNNVSINKAPILPRLNRFYNSFAVNSSDSTVSLQTNGETRTLPSKCLRGFKKINKASLLNLSISTLH